MAICIVCTNGAAVYIWQRGDDVEQVARRFQTTAEQIRAINTGRDLTRLEPGEPICVPTRERGCPDADMYTVREGESMQSIARGLGARLGELMELNPYIDPDRLSVGQVICVPKSARKDCGTDAERRTVRFGDTLSSLLERHDLSLNRFMELNPALDAEHLTPGTRYCVPAGRGCAGSGSYTWATGDTLETVAERFGTTAGGLLKANPSLRPTDFTEGKEICVPASE